MKLQTAILFLQEMRETGLMPATPSREERIQAVSMAIEALQRIEEVRSMPHYVTPSVRGLLLGEG